MDVTPVWSPLLFTTAALSSQDQAGPKVSPTEQGVTLWSLWPQATLINWIQMWVWKEQGLRGGTAEN